MDVVKVNPFTNVAANQLATTQFIPDRPLALVGIALVLGGTAFTIDAHVSLVTVKSGGKELVRMTGARLDDLNNNDGLVTDAAHLFIPFGDLTANSLRGKLLGAFDMTLYSQPLTIEVTIGGATAPTLDAYAVIIPPKGVLANGELFTADEVQIHRAFIESIVQPSAAVSRKAYGLSLGSNAGALIRRLALFHANLTSVAVKRNGLDIFDDVSAALNNYLHDDVNARVAVAGLYPWFPTVTADQSFARATVNPDGSPANFQVLLTTSGGDTITAYADVYTKLSLI